MKNRQNQSAECLGVTGPAKKMKCVAVSDAPAYSTALPFRFNQNIKIDFTIGFARSYV